MLTGKEYLDSISVAIQEEIETELQRLEYFLKANSRIHNGRFPLIFSVKNCRFEVIEAIAIHLENAGWSVNKTKEYLQISPKVQQIVPTPLPRK